MQDWAWASFNFIERSELSVDYVYCLECPENYKCYKKYSVQIGRRNERNPSVNKHYRMHCKKQ